MKFVLFYHSLVSDWNHGHAHFLRGVVSELLDRGHEVEVYEPERGWSLSNLLADKGASAIDEFHAAFPELRSRFYKPGTLDLDEALDGADVVIVHEWNELEWIARIGERAAGLGCMVLFHDTHHRSVTDSQTMSSLDLRNYDGVLAFGKAVADRYAEGGWARHAWVWHEAADLRRFYPHPRTEDSGDLVWIGNWGDDERGAELYEFLIKPVSRLNLRATIHGVRYPGEALDTLREAHINYAGWIANHRVPAVFANYGCTVHVPRRMYAEQLHGIPTIRMFEALACGIPLISAPWYDEEHLFRPGVDYLVATDGAQMERDLKAVLHEPDLANSLVRHGLETIQNRHSCAHRVDELLAIVQTLRPPVRPMQSNLLEAPVGGQI
jgi:spore maturation protein CgeB